LDATKPPCPPTVWPINAIAPPDRVPDMVIAAVFVSVMSPALPPAPALNLASVLL
jgi:hypothetical protein